jgi:hypothetical protein
MVEYVGFDCARMDEYSLPTSSSYEVVWVEMLIKLQWIAFELNIDKLKLCAWVDE